MHKRLSIIFLIASVFVFFSAPEAVAQKTLQKHEQTTGTGGGNGSGSSGQGSGRGKGGSGRGGSNGHVDGSRRSDVDNSRVDPSWVQVAPQRPRQSRISPGDGVNGGYEWVDLGLPSGLKWATCNVGASSPVDFGNYYAWSEVSTKSKYSEDNCQSLGKQLDWLTGNGYIDNSGRLTGSHDPAKYHWSNGWRTPTSAEIDELTDERYTSLEWTSIDDVSGLLIKSKRNGKTIFLPAGGRKQEYDLYGTNQGGFYWCSDIYKEYDDFFDFAYQLAFSGPTLQKGYTSHHKGNTIRPVCR